MRGGVERTKRLLRAVLPAAAILLGGCLASPVERSGSPGSITVPNTNPAAVAAAARAVFARYGYAPGPSALPRHISFERAAGRTGEIMFGSPVHNNTAIRVRLDLVPIAGTRDIRVMPSVSRVRNAGRAGFEDETGMLLRSWSAQFRPALREIKARSANAGPGRAGL